MHMRATGMLLKVRSMLALTPGGGSNTKIRPALSKLTGTWREEEEEDSQNAEKETKTESWRAEVVWGRRGREREKADLGVDLHGEEEAEAGVRLHGVQLLLQLHQPARSQVDVLQHDPPAAAHKHRFTRSTRKVYA